MEELQWWISLHVFHIREHNHQSSPWVKGEWFDFELFWHLASLMELPLPTYSLSQKQSLLLISATGSSLVDKRAAWDDVRGQIPEPAHSHLQLSCPGKCWQNFSLLLFIVPSTPTAGGVLSVLLQRPCVPAVYTYGRNTVADFGAVPGLWKPSFFSIHNIHENVCFSCYHLDPELHSKRKKKGGWQVVGELIHFLCQFSPFTSQHNYQTSILWQISEQEHFIHCGLS